MKSRRGGRRRGRSQRGGWGREAEQETSGADTIATMMDMTMLLDKEVSPVSSEAKPRNSTLPLIVADVDVTLNETTRDSDR